MNAFGSIADMTGVVVRTTFVLLVAEALVRLLANRAASLRHAVWAAALFGSLVLFIAAAVRLPALVTVPTQLNVATHESAPPSRPVSGEVSQIDLMPASASSPTSGRDALWDTARENFIPPLARSLLFVWLVGAVLAFLRLCNIHLQARALVKRAEPFGNPRVLARWDASCRRHRVDRAELRESDELTTPATVGVVQFTVLLPPAAATWDAEVIEAVLEHELAHVRRRDGLVHLMAQLAMVMHWYHPLVRHAVRMLAAERERSCDDVVLASGMPPVRYAELLLWAAQSASVRVPPAPVLAFSGASELEDRLDAILNTQLSRRQASRRNVMGCFIAATTIAVISSTVQVDAATADALHQSHPPMHQTQAGNRLPAREPDRLGDSVSAPRSELIDMSRWGTDPSAVIANAEQAALRHLAGPDSILARSLLAGVRHQPKGDADLVRDRSAWALLSAAEGGLTAHAVDALADSNWRARAYGAWTLGVAGHHALTDRRALPRLIALLDDPVWRVRSAAAFAMFDVGSVEALPGMRRALGDAAWQVRLAAVEFLIRFGNTTDRATLEPLRNDRHIAVRQAAANALSQSQ